MRDVFTLLSQLVVLCVLIHVGSNEDVAFFEVLNTLQLYGIVLVWSFPEILNFPSI